MHHRPRVGVGQRMRHLRQEARQRPRRRPELERVRAQRHPIDQLHRDPAVRSAPPARQQAHHSRMIELRHGRRLAIEAADVVGNGGERLAQDLDGDLAAVRAPGGAEDLPHASLPEPLVEHEAVDRGHRLRLIRR